MSRSFGTELIRQSMRRPSKDLDPVDVARAAAGCGRKGENMDERSQRLQQMRARRRKNELVMKCVIVLLSVILLILTVVLVKELVFGEHKSRTAKVAQTNQ